MSKQTVIFKHELEDVTIEWQGAGWYGMVFLNSNDVVWRKLPVEAGRNEVFEVTDDNRHLFEHSGSPSYVESLDEFLDTL